MKWKQNDDDSETMWKQHKTKLILLVIAAFFLLAAGVYTGFKLGRSSKGSMLAADPNAVAIDRNYLNTLQYNTSTASQGNFIHHLFTDLYFSSNTTTQELPAWNDPENPYNLMVTLNLSGEEEPLAASGLIPPGQMLSSITLAHALTVGDYDATLLCTPIDDHGNTYGSLSAKVVIHVVDSK